MMCRIRASGTTLLHLRTAVQTIHRIACKIRRLYCPGPRQVLCRPAECHVTSSLWHHRLDACRMAESNVQITKKAEEACLYKLKQHALKIKCEEQARAYAECCNGRSFSMVWACKPLLNDLNACLKQSTRRDIQQEVFRRYAAAGRPERPDWDALLAGL